VTYCKQKVLLDGHTLRMEEVLTYNISVGKLSLQLVKGESGLFPNYSLA
jgi:hypothetical protein